jgi:purine-cytosine permease-like protein
MASDAKPGIFERLDKLYEFDRQPVTADKLQPGRYFAGVFSGEHIAATEFVIGALFVSLGATVYDVLVGLLVGNAAAVLSWTLVCAPIAVKTRLTLYWYLRKIAGPAVTVIYNVLNAILFCILAGAMITVSASAVRIPFGIKPQTGWLPNDPWFVPLVLVLGAVVVTLATLGFRRLAQFASICSPWMVVMFVAGALVVLRLLGPVRSWASFYDVADRRIWTGPAPGQAHLGFWHVAAFAWICNLATHLGLSDMALFRYARRASYGLYSAFGMFLGHYVAWVCAGIMGAATVTMIAAQQQGAGSEPISIAVARMGSPPPRTVEGDGQEKPAPTPTLAPAKGKAVKGKDGAPPAGAKGGPAAGKAGKSAPSEATKQAAQERLKPTPADPEAERSPPPTPPAAQQDGDGSRSADAWTLKGLQNVDSGEVAFRSLGLIGIVVVVLAGWTTANPTLYRAGLALQAVTPGWSRWVVTVLAGAITTLVACSPFVFRRLLDFVAIYGILLVPVGAIVVAEHWIFPLLGLTQFWSTRKRQRLNWPALASWLAGLAIAAGAWISKYAFDYEILHEFFLIVPVWIATTVLYIVLAACAGAREQLPELVEEPGPAPAPAPAPKAAVEAKPLNLVEKGLVYLSALAGVVSLGYWLVTAVQGHFKALRPRSYEDLSAVPDELTYHHLVFLVSAVIFLHLWEKSLPWRPTLYYASGLVALVCLAMCVLCPLGVFVQWIMDEHVKSHLIPLSLGYFIAAIIWLRQREKMRGEGRGARGEG